MKSRILFLLLILHCGAGICSTSMIVCGNIPGEIYFVGVHATLPGSPAFYISSNYGESIEMRNNCGYNADFGVLLSDAQEGTIYRVFLSDHYYSTDGGFNWNLVDSTVTYAYASGVIPGEIYRTMTTRQLERSVNYGASYTPCTCAGGPDSLGIGSAALGADSGEVYIWGDHGKLYYSNDYAENFNFLNDLYQTWGISPWTVLINGTEPGEIYLYHEFSKIVWRVSNFGANVEMLEDFPPVYDFWYGGIATTRQPGELYFYAVHLDMMPGGTMHIYHTTNYFLDWTVREYNVPPQGIGSQDDQYLPTSTKLEIFPNPTNSAFNIFYHLNEVSDTNLNIYNLLGQKIWEYSASLQNPGSYRLSVSGDHFSTGTYILQLRTQTKYSVKSFKIIK